MAGTWGNFIKVSIFGESHGAGIGVVVDGLPAGLAVDMGAVEKKLARRAPGAGDLTTPRREQDAVELLSGVYKGRLTGTPVCALIRNRDQHSGDYAKEMDVPRPGHADYTGHVRYKGYEDPRGGGHFSGRLTAPIVFAGALAESWIAGMGVAVAARAVRVGDAVGEALDERMRGEILSARCEGDSVGGIVECRVKGIPAGLGAPFFDSAESLIAHLLFSIPGVKGVEFGLGFGMARLRGSECNDEMVMVAGRARHRTNRSGGVLGGVTNGEDLVFRCALRPTPSIARTQASISLARGEDVEIAVRGRHDPCIVPRAIPVVEAVAALAVAEMWKEREACRI